MRDTATSAPPAADLPPATGRPRAQGPAAPDSDAPPLRRDAPSAARVATHRAEAEQARAALVAGAAARQADRERARQRLMEERRRREADPAERAARDGVVARARRDADEARARLRARLDAAPGARRTSPRRPWAPLSHDEWAVLAPFVVRSAGPGRPVRDPRGRLDAIFWLAARPQRHLPPWRELPEALSGKRDTVARQFRRWARAGLWTRLLEALADPDRPGIAVLRRLESWICRTYRRAWRILGTAGVVLARRLGFLSALRAPSVFLPDPDLSHSVKTRLLRLRDCLREKGEAAMRAMLPRPDFLKVAHHLLRDATGGRRISRHMAWP